MSLDKPGALCVVTCSAGILRQLQLLLEVSVSNLKFLLLPYVCRPLVRNILRLFHERCRGLFWSGSSALKKIRVPCFKFLYVPALRVFKECCLYI